MNKDAEAEVPIVWPPDAKNWLTGRDPDAGKDWRWEEKGTTEDEMVGWHHRLDGHEFEKALGVHDVQGSLLCAVHEVTKSRTGLSDWTQLIPVSFLMTFVMTPSALFLPHQFLHNCRCFSACSLSPTFKNFMQMYNFCIILYMAYFTQNTHFSVIHIAAFAACIHICFLFSTVVYYPIAVACNFLFFSCQWIFKLFHVFGLYTQNCCDR